MFLLPTSLLALISLPFLSTAAFPSSSTFTLERRAVRPCVPSISNSTVLYLFESGSSDMAWEHLPPAGRPQATSGGAFYVSETDDPENGGFYLLDSGNGTFALSLASKEPGVQCVRTVGKNRALTTGGCELEKAKFLLSCTSCPSPTSSTLSSSGNVLARACTLTSATASSGFAVTLTPPSEGVVWPGLQVRKKEGRKREQSWDLRRA